MSMLDANEIISMYRIKFAMRVKTERILLRQYYKLNAQEG